MIRLLPGVVGEVVEVGQHLRLPVLGHLQRPVVENIKVVKKRGKEEELISNLKKNTENAIMLVLVKKLLINP